MTQTFSFTTFQPVENSCGSYGERVQEVFVIDSCTKIHKNIKKQKPNPEELCYC